jgi:hypothetical protein
VDRLCWLPISIAPAVGLRASFCAKRLSLPGWASSRPAEPTRTCGRRNVAKSQWRMAEIGRSWPKIGGIVESAVFPVGQHLRARSCARRDEISGDDNPLQGVRGSSPLSSTDRRRSEAVGDGAASLRLVGQWGARPRAVCMAARVAVVERICNRRRHGPPWLSANARACLSALTPGRDRRGQSPRPADRSACK